MLRATVILLVLLAALAAQAAPVRIRGLTTMSESRALEMLGERLAFVEARPANPARADDAAFFLRRLLVRDGFNDAQVAWAISPDGVILLTVNEGTRLSLGDITLIGVDDPSLRRAILDAFEQPGSRRQSAFARPPFLEEDVAAALERVTAEFQARGFWEPQVRITQQTIEPATGNVNLVLEARPGPQFILTRPIVGGELAGYAADLDALLARYASQVANTEAIDGARRKVEDFFHARGHARALVEVGALRAAGLYTMVFRIDAGPRFRFGTFSFLGLDRTDPARVGARFAGLQGGNFSETALNKPVAELLATGAFASVHTEQVANPDGSMDLVMEFKEGKARGISAYTGVGSFEGPIVGAGYFDRNFAGRLLNLNIGGEMTARGLFGEVRLTNPWLFETRIHGTARLYAITRDFDGYDKAEAGLAGALTWQLTKPYQLTLAGGTSYVNIDPGGIPRSQTGETVYSHNYLRLTQKYERRDNPLSPRKGFFAQLDLESGAAVGGSTASYLSTEARASYSIPLGERDHATFSLRNGVILPTGADLPIDLRFFQGGPDSVRSFPLRRMGDQSASGDPLGGEAYWTGNAEYVHNLVGALEVVGFSDVGTLSRKFTGYGLENVEVAVGAGLRLDLPIGPIRLEYGHNLTRDRGEPSGAFHFTIGISF